MIDKAPFQKTVLDRSIESSEANTRKKTISRQGTTQKSTQRKVTTPAQRKSFAKTATCMTQSQCAVILNALREKALDVMKKSSVIYGLMQKYNENVMTVCDALFCDGLFKAGNILITSC